MGVGAYLGAKCLERGGNRRNTKKNQQKRIAKQGKIRYILHIKDFVGFLFDKRDEIKQVSEGRK